MDALADDGETLKFFGASSRCGDAGAQSQTFATNHRWSYGPVLALSRMDSTYV